MRAAVSEAYGGPEVVRVAEVSRPGCAADEVVVRVVASAVNASDSRVRGARFPRGFAPLARLVFGVRRPRRRVLGGVYSGVVEEVGSATADLAPGDSVCGMTGINMGSHAEFVAVKAEATVLKPAGIGHEEAAGALFGGTTALHFLRDRAKLTPGKTVLVNGASGAVGTAAVQLARHYGGVVTAVTSTANMELVTELGAATVVDYTTTALGDLDQRFDVVFDTVGNVSIASGRQMLNPGGVLLLAVASLSETLLARGNVVTSTAPERPEDMAFLLDLVDQGRLNVVIDSVYSLDEIVAAHRRVDSGRKVGNVIVRLA